MTVTEERLQQARARARTYGLNRLSVEDMHVLALSIAREADMTSDLPADLRPAEEPAFQFRVSGRPARGDTHE